MILATVLETLEAALDRQLVTTNYGDTVSYPVNGETVTVNSTSYSHAERLCLLCIDNVTYLYINSYDARKRIKINISTINTLSIT